MSQAFSATAFYAAWFLLGALHPRLPWYLPLERTVAMAVPPGSVGMDFYAKVALAVLAGAVGFGVGALLERRSSVETVARWRTRGWTWALSLLVLCASMEAVVLSHRAPVALPLPPGMEAPKGRAPAATPEAEE